MYIEQANLSKRLIRECYGPIVETVAGVLIRDGRLPLGLLIKNTKLSAREVKQALVVLIQHGVVTHAASKEGAGGRMVTYYSANTRVVLKQQRLGLYLALVEERMGKEGMAVFRTIMENGIMSIGTVKERLGSSEWSQAAQIKLDAATSKLVRERFIVAVAPGDTVTRIDKTMEAEAVELDKLAVLPTAKELLTIRRMLNDRAEQEYSNTSVVGIKRVAEEEADGHVSKVVVGPDGRTLVVANGTNGTDETNGNESQDTVDQTQCFRVYYDRLDVFLRNQQLVNYFADKYNAGAGAIVKAMLRITESRTKTCRDRRSEVLSVAQVINQLPQDAPLADAVDTGSDMFFQDLAASATSGNGTAKGGSGNGALTPAKRTELAFALLEVVRADASGIVVKVDDRGGGQYQLNFDRAANALRDQSLDTLVHEKFGSLHARIVRVLRDKQKLDEKSVATAAMMPIAACRERLHDLALAGFIDSYEIARTVDRNPSRMFYLWYINPQKQTRAAMRYIFKSMTNVFARLDRELAARAPLVAKTKRADVAADQSLLTDSEKNELAALSAAQTRLEVANVRLDGMLLAVHDISPEHASF
ncbi:RNA polymerase III subunit C82 [Coemansia sp. RSA 2049]|nr:RNA polymerase III subunit C82 [Coemansia sp. RSA 2049]KAJ2511710.1 RNA polymerase III subunit C82 [Coemansia sp. RSA 1939]